MPEAFFPNAILFAFAAAAITTLGLVAVSMWHDWTRAQTGWFAAFAAGALISIAILHLLPNAFKAAPNAPAYLLAGFAGAYFLNSGILKLEQAGRARLINAGLLPVFAIAFHSFVDGIAYAVTFSVGFVTGLLTVIGLIFHEVPEGIITFTLLQRAGFDHRRALLMAFAAAALTTPLGAIAGVTTMAGVGEATLGILFAVTAGVLLYIGTAHLLPHVDKEPLYRKVPALLLGGFIGIGASLFHSHAEEAAMRERGPGFALTEPAGELSHGH